MNASPALVRPQLASEFDAYIALWVTRLSARHAIALQQFNQGLYAEELRQLVGIAPVDGKLPKARLRSLIKTRADELNDRPRSAANVLARNITMLSQLLGLKAIDADILTFAALTCQHPLLSDFVESIRMTSLDMIVDIFATALGHSVQEVQDSLRPSGLLIRTKILSIDRGDVGRGLIVGISASLVSALFRPAQSIQELMDAFLELAPHGKLDADDFSHLSDESKLLIRYLRTAADKKTPGINILIYGLPGTGKTEYVRWIAKKIKRRLYQVKATDPQDKPLSGEDRLTSFQLAQHFLQASQSLILFDEIEDVFPAIDTSFELLLRTHQRGPGKMFINQLLETNPVPAIWVANEVSHIDKAFLRRFDFSFEMPIPPIGARRRILSNYLQRTSVKADTLRYLAQQDQLSPAQIEKACKVTQLACSRLAEQDDTLRFVIENSMALLEQDITESAINFTESSYRLDYLNPDCDIKRLVTQLKQSEYRQGAICFYGPPGTGKTALAHYLAHELDAPLIARRASDVFGPYVGETEQKIAAMFKQAQLEDAILLLDEADSFLTERRSARQQWEVSAVNEMLTQMERFDGLFICSTNLMQSLDEASLRRFALKVRFDYLSPEQRWNLFCEQAKCRRTRNEARYQSALRQLSNLTPGDFATVRRQAKLMGISLTADELLARLQRECRNKRNASQRPIGFVTT